MKTAVIALGVVCLTVIVEAKWVWIPNEPVRRDWYPVAPVRREECECDVGSVTGDAGK